MASWFDLKGTFQTIFKVGKNKTSIDANAPTASRNFYMPDSEVDLRSGTVGQIISQTGANTIGWLDNYSEALVTGAFNDTGSTITKGQVVYFNGRQGDRPKAFLAQANALNTSEKTVGLAYETIGTGLDIRVVESGLIKGINTDVVGWVEGDILWLDAAVAGGVTNVRPTGSNYAIEIGLLVRKHINQGVILVRVDDNPKLSQLQDVSIPTTPNNGDVLTFEASTSLWKAMAGGSGASGFTEIANGGTISGSYNGSVYCAGTVTLTGNVTVKGSILAEGKVTNTGGYSLTVKGDCIFKGEVDFQTNNGIAPGNISIDGNFYTGERSTPYPLRSIVPSVPDTSAAPVFAMYSSSMPTYGSFQSVFSSINAVASDNQIQINGDWTFYAFSVVKVEGGPNDGTSQNIISMTYDSINNVTDIVTDPFASTFNSTETSVVFDPYTLIAIDSSFVPAPPSFTTFSGTVSGGSNSGSVESFTYIGTSYTIPSFFSLYTFYSVSTFSNPLLSSDFFSIQENPYSSNNTIIINGDWFSILLAGYSVYLIFGSTTVEVETIISATYDGTNTTIITNPFTLNLDGTEQIFLGTKNMLSTNVNYGAGQSLVVDGTENDGVVNIVAQSFPNPNGFGFIVTFVNTFAANFTTGTSLISAYTDQFYTKWNFKEYTSWGFTLMPRGTKFKFTSTSSNPNALCVVSTSAPWYSGLGVNDPLVQLQSSLANPILDTDKFYTIDDMGMLFTWDTGSAPSINVKGNYYTIGGIYAAPRSGNLVGANINISGDLLATHSNSALVNGTEYIGAKLFVGGSGSGYGGSVNIVGRVSQCSIITKGQSAVEFGYDANSGNGGDVKVGAFDGILRMSTSGNAPSSGNYLSAGDYYNYSTGSYVDAQGGIQVTIGFPVRTAGDGGDFSCVGTFVGMALFTRGGGGNSYTSSNDGGSSGSIEIGSDCKCSFIYCESGHAVDTGELGKFYVNGDLTFILINASGGMLDFVSIPINGVYSGNYPELTYTGYISQGVSGIPTAVVYPVMINGDVKGVVSRTNQPFDGSMPSSILLTPAVDSNARALFINGNCELSGIISNTDTTGSGSIVRIGGNLKISLFDVVGGYGGLCGNVTVYGNVEKFHQNNFGPEFRLYAYDNSKGVSGGSVTVYGNFGLLNGGGTVRIYSTGSARIAGVGGLGNAGSGGNVNIQGKFEGYDINNFGGFYNVLSGTGSAGNGGNISLGEGSFIQYEIINRGGARDSSSGAGNAGRGGNISLKRATVPVINANGNTNGVSGGVAGAIGSTYSFIDCDISVLALLENTGGAGGSTPTASVDIYFGGYTKIVEWNITNRSQIKLRGNVEGSRYPTSIFCSSRSGKIQLTKNDGTETTTLTASDWITIFDGTNWYTQAVTGPKA